MNYYALLIFTLLFLGLDTIWILALQFVLSFFIVSPWIYLIVSIIGILLVVPFIVNQLIGIVEEKLLKGHRIK